MMSCPERAALRQATRQNLGQTDWQEDVTVVVDRCDCARGQDRMERTARRLLEVALGSADWDYILFLEDDLKFNRHLRHNLLEWKPLCDRKVTLASLYNPAVRQRQERPLLNYSVACTEAVYGSQAFLIERTCTEYCALHYDEVQGLQDIKLSRLAARLGPIYYHMPSLVQHVGHQSAWGGVVHQAADFDEDFRMRQHVEGPPRTWADLPGWFDFSDVYQLAVSRATHGDRFVEVGCWLGRSTAFMAECIRRSRKQVGFFVVDTFQGSPSEPDLLRQVRELGGSLLPVFRENMSACGCLDDLHMVVGDSAAAAAQFADSSLAFIFIDADHSADAIEKDIRSWLPKLKPDGWMAGHDYCSFRSVAEVVNRLLPGHRCTGNTWIYRG